MPAEVIDTPPSASLAPPARTPTRGKLEIEGNGLPGQTAIRLDGHDLTPTVRGLRLTMDIRSGPAVELDLPMPDVNMIAIDQVEVSLPDELVALLLHLGWSPPGEET
jgi:hypothetical protein